MYGLLWSDNIWLRYNYLSGFCHFGLVLFMVLWQSPDTPVMSGSYVSAWFRVCSSRVLSRLRVLFRVGAWCSDPALMSWVSCLGSDTCAPRSVSLCERAVLSSLGRTLFCSRVFCGVARSSCFHQLHVFMLCLVLCGTQLVYFIGFVLSCCHVLCEHMVYEFSH